MHFISKHSLSLIIGILIAITAIGGSIWYYTTVYIPDQVVESVNNNVSILNENLEEIDYIINRINTQYDSLTTASESSKSTIQEIQDSNARLSDVIIKSNNALDQVDGGFNEDTKAFAKSTLQALKKRISSLNTIRTVIDYDSCFNTHLIEFIEDNKELVKTISIVSERSVVENRQEVIDLNTSARDSIDSAKNSLDNIKTCISQYDSVSNSELLANYIDPDIEQYTNFSIFLTQLIEGIEEDNIDKINEAQNNTSGFVDSKLLKNNNYQKSVLTSNTIIQEKYSEITTLEDEIEDEIDDIKKKYSLS